MAGLAGRLLTAATALMPASRRGWGRALLAELSYTPARRDRARLVAGAWRVALLPRRPGSYAGAAARACAVGAVAWVPLGLGLYLGNVVFPAVGDRPAGMLVMDVYLIAVLMAAGALARRRSPGRGVPAVAGLASGLVLAVLGLGTLAAIDNLFLPVVSHQTEAMDGFRASGMTSMRGYLNASLAAAAPGVTLLLALGGALLASLGARAARPPAPPPGNRRQAAGRGYRPR